MPLWKRALRLVVIITLTPVIFLLGCQSSLIYHPSPYRAEYERMLVAAKGARLSFTTSQGRQTAFYIPTRKGGAGLPRTIWLCFAGNASLALDWLRVTDEWDAGFAYLLVDYPGYGDCAGKPNPGNIRESGKAAFTALAGHLQTPEKELTGRMAVLGHSLGCAAALMTATDLDVRRGVLVSPFTSMTDMGRVVLGWPLCHLNMHRFDNRKTLRAVAGREGARLIVFHGAEDEVIPVAMGRELAGMAPEVVTFHELAGAHHNDVLYLAYYQIGQAMKALAR
ncbi:MAG: alpha/beta hydrolase [Prosthecobacter sp.]